MRKHLPYIKKVIPNLARSLRIILVATLLVIMGIYMHAGWPDIKSHTLSLSLAVAFLIIGHLTFAFCALAFEYEYVIYSIFFGTGVLISWNWGLDNYPDQATLTPLSIALIGTAWLIYRTYCRHNRKVSTEA